MGLLDACVAVGEVVGVSLIRNLRLVSEAASKLALQAITGYKLQRGRGPVANSVGSPPDNPVEVLLGLDSKQANDSW